MKKIISFVLIGGSVIGTTFGDFVITNNPNNLQSLFQKYNIKYPSDSCELNIPDPDIAQTEFSNAQEGEIMKNFVMSSLISVGTGILAGVGASSVLKTTALVNKILKIKKLDKLRETLTTTKLTAAGAVVGGAVPLYKIITYGLNLNMIDNKKLYEIEKNLYIDLLEYLSSIMTCYKIDDPDKLNRIYNNLVYLDALISQTKSRSKVDTLIFVASSTIPVSYNNWDEFYKTYKETLELINSLRKEPTSFIKKIEINKEAEEIKSKILLGELDITDLEGIDKEVLKKVLEDKEVLKLIKEKYPTLSEKDKQFFVTLLKENIIHYVNQKVAMDLQNFRNLLHSLDGYIPVRDLEDYISASLDNPFLDEEDEKKVIRYVILKLKDRIDKIIVNNEQKDSILASQILSYLSELNEDNYKEILPKLTDMINNYFSIKNFNDYIKKMEEYVNSVKYAISKYNIDLTDVYVQLVSTLEKIKEDYEEKKYFELQKDLDRFNILKSKISYKIIDNLNKILKIQSETEIGGSIQRKNIDLKINNYIKVFFDKKIFPLLEGVKIPIYRISKRDISDIKVKPSTDSINIVKEESPFDWVIYIIPLREDDNSYEVEVDYILKNAFVYDSKYSFMYTKGNGLVKYTLKLKPSKDVKNYINDSQQIPINTYLKYAKGDMLLGSIIYVTVPSSPRTFQFTFNEEGVNVNINKGVPKKYFSEDLGSFYSRTDQIKIENSESVTFLNNSITLRLKDVQDLNSITVSDEYGNVVYENDNVVNDILTIPIPKITPGKNYYYVTYIYLSREQKMKNGLKRMEKKLKEIKNYLSIIDQKADIPHPEINKLLIKVSNEIEKLEESVKEDDYEMYSQIMNDLNYDMNDLYSKTLDLLNKVLGTSKTLELIIQNIDKKINEMKTLMELSKIAFSEKEYQKYNNKIMEFSTKLEEIKELMKYKELNTAFDKAKRLQSLVDSYYDIVKEKIMTKRFILYNNIMREILYLENQLSKIEDYDPSLAIYKNKIEVFLNSLKDLENKQNSLNLEFEIINEIQNEIEMTKLQITQTIQGKIEKLKKENEQKLRDIQEYYFKLKNTIEALEILGVKTSYYNLLEKKLNELEEVIREVKELEQQMTDDPLQQYYILLKIRSILEEKEVDIDTIITNILRESKKTLNEHIEEKKRELYALLEKEKDDKTKYVVAKLIKQLNELSDNLSSAKSLEDLLIVKEKLKDIDNTPIGIGADTGNPLFRYSLILLLVIGGAVVTYRIRDKIKRYIKNLKKNKKRDNNKNVKVEDKLPPKENKKEVSIKHEEPVKSKSIVEDVYKKETRKPQQDKLKAPDILSNVEPKELIKPKDMKMAPQDKFKTLTTPEKDTILLKKEENVSNSKYDPLFELSKRLEKR